LFCQVQESDYIRVSEQRNVQLSRERQLEVIFERERGEARLMIHNI
jgi:hypothetical protein